jgi:hypothetical protein
MASGGRVRSGPEMARIVERNIAALLAHRREADRRKGWQVRLADAITAFAGKPGSSGW